MRFSIRDLLLWTTITAIYAALAGALISRGLLNYEANRIPNYLVIAAIAPSAFRYLFALVRSGRPYLSFRRKLKFRKFWEYSGLIFLPCLLTGYFISIEEALPVGFLLLPALISATNELMAQVSLGRLGVVYYFGFYSWKDHRFEIEPETTRLRMTALSEAARKWGHPYISVTIPADRIEEVRAILEAKQAATGE